MRYRPPTRKCEIALLLILTYLCEQWPFNVSAATHTHSMCSMMAAIPSAGVANKKPHSIDL